MAKIDDLIRNYEGFAKLPWSAGLSGPQKVWFAIYDPTDERRARHRIGEFANATARAGRSWHLVDLTDAFAEWMAAQEYRAEYFVAPGSIQLALADFRAVLSEQVREALVAADENTIVAVQGAATLFGCLRVSELIDDIAGDISGRLLVLFPGTHEDGVYRLLDARDGWSYHAVPITA